MQNSDLIKRYEGCSLVAYLDDAKIPTIGYGTTIYKSGVKVKLGDIITGEQADEELEHHAEIVEGNVRRLVKQALTENQMAALVSLVYNIGIGNFTTSTMLKLINSPKFDKNKVSLEFLKWDKIRVDGELVKSKGLMNRRLDEMKVFLTA